MARPRYPYMPAGLNRKQRWHRLFRRVLTAAAIFGVLIACAGVWLSRSLPDAVAAELGRLTNTHVETGVFNLRLDGSVSIDGLVIRPLGSEPRYDNAILHAKNVYARFSRRSLALFSPRVAELRIEDFVLDAQLDLDTEQWNLGVLEFSRLRGHSGRGTIPTIQLQKGKLRYCKVSGGNVEVVMSVPVEARFGTGSAEQGYAFEVRTSQLSSGQGESHLSGYWRPGDLTLAGGLSSTDLPSLERAWAVDVLAAHLRYDATGDYKLELRLKDLHGKQAPEVGVLRLIAPTGPNRSGPLVGLQRFFDQYRPTGTVGSVTLTAGGNLRRPFDSEVLGKLVCNDVSVCNARFPYTIDHLAGEVDFTQSGVVMRQLLGKHGDVDVQIEGWTKGHGAERQYRYKISSGNMILNEDLYAALQPGQKRLWDAFRPTGTVAADYWLVRTSPADRRMYLSVDLKGVAARFREFPYPLTDLTGEMYFDRDGITATNLVSESGGRRVRLNAKVSGQAAGKPIYYVSIDANDIPLDATLEKALPSQYRELYGQLEAEGVADVRARVFSTGDANNAGPVSYLADVVCRGRSLKVERLPVVLSDVVAEMSVSPDSVNIKSLDGLYGESRVALTGGMRLGPDRKSRRYHAKIAAEKVPFNETTIGLLPKSLAGQLAAFRPEGNVNLRVEIDTPDGNEAPVYAGEVECLGIQIDHPRVAYPLRDVHGTISVARDKLQLKNVTASPVDPCQPDGSAAIYIDGSATFAGGSFAEGSFTVKTQDMLFTEKLGAVLPRSLAGLYRDVSPQGIFTLDVGRLTVSRAAPDEALVEFEGRADVKVCDVRLSGTGMEVSGVAKAEGSYSTKRGLSKGRVGLAAERLVIKGKTVSNVTVDAAYDPNARMWSADGCLGDCCGGKVLGTLHVGRADAGSLEYMLQVALNRVDLQRFLQDGKPAVEEKPFSGGVMNAALSLGGRVGDAASRRGACRVDITDMQVGKVSPLANLLSVLSLSEPTDYTFERMLIDSYIKPGALLIRNLDMSGRNVAFTGSGTMALPGGDLNLVLTARGQRLAAAEPSMLQALTEGLGGAVVRMEVTGRAGDPRVETKTLPVIEDSLRILGTPE